MGNFGGQEGASVNKEFIKIVSSCLRVIVYFHQPIMQYFFFLGGGGVYLHKNNTSYLLFELYHVLRQIPPPQKKMNCIMGLVKKAN